MPDDSFFMAARRAEAAQRDMGPGRLLAGVGAVSRPEPAPRHREHDWFIAVFALAGLAVSVSLGVALAQLVS